MINPQSTNSPWGLNILLKQLINLMFKIVIKNPPFGILYGTLYHKNIKSTSILMFL